MKGTEKVAVKANCGNNSKPIKTDSLADGFDWSEKRNFQLKQGTGIIITTKESQQERPIFKGTFLLAFYF